MAVTAEPWWSRGARAQSRTIGALILRELHTRFGRDNVGYLWLFIEPALLGLGIAAMHVFSRMNTLPWGMQLVPFYVSGYTAYVTFRGTTNRAASTIEANGSLLYHRGVTIVDLVLARTILDTVAPFVAGLLLMAGAAALDFGHMPGRPLLFLWAWFLNLWFCFGVSMLVLASGVQFPSLDRVIHPFTYLMLPVSNVFTLFEQLPPSGIRFMVWVPTAHIGELVREGVFETFDSAISSSTYVIGWCLALTLLGLAALAAVRRKVEFE